MGIRITTEVQSVEDVMLMEGTEFGLLYTTAVKVGIIAQRVR